MKQLLEVRVCKSGKQSFQNEDHALGAVERANVRQLSLRAYRCQWCRMWHVTKKKAPKMKQRKPYVDRQLRRFQHG